MASLRGGKSTAVGLFADGQEVKLAKLSLKRGRVVVEELRSATLVSRLEEHRAVEAMGEAGAPTDEFAGAGAALPEVSGGEDNSAVFLSLLSPYPAKKYSIGYSVAEPSIFYHAVEAPGDAKGKKLKARIIQEIQSARASAPLPDAVDSFQTADGGVTAVVREDGLGLYRLMEGVKPFMGNRLPAFTLVDSADLSVMGLARANYGFGPDEITVIIYVGVEFSRLVFMRGPEFFHFAPILGEGYDSPNIQNTIYSRLLLEQDSIGIPRLDRILIAGEARRISFDEFLKEQLPEIDIQYLQTPYLDVSQLPAESQDQVPEYAIPIATAWKILQEQHPAFYRINLIPVEVREGQRVFKLAWHGYLLLAAIFFSTFFFTTRITGLRSRIASQEVELAQKQIQAKVNEQLRADIAELRQQMEGFRTALGVYNTIVPGHDRWSRVVSTLANNFARINSVWVTDLNADADMKMIFNGFTLFKAKVPRVAKIFEASTLRSVNVLDIRERTVYNFKVEVQLPKEKK